MGAGWENPRSCANSCDGLWKARHSGFAVSDPVIDVGRLTEDSGPTIARIVTFAVRRGEVFVLRMLLGPLRPSKGNAIILGHSIVRDSFGVRQVSHA